MKRICRVCKIEQDIIEFLRIKTRPTARRWECRSCRNKTKRQQHLLPKHRFTYYRRQAKRRNITFTLTYKEFIRYWGQPCNYCGRNIETIGLDRKNDYLGYEKNNIFSCCRLCNSIKNFIRQYLRRWKYSKGALNKIIENIVL